MSPSTAAVVGASRPGATASANGHVWARGPSSTSRPDDGAAGSGVSHLPPARRRISCPAATSQGLVSTYSAASAQPAAVWAS